MRIAFAALATFAYSAAPGSAAEPVNAEFFEKHVRPLFATHCLTCHDPKKEKGGLLLTSRAAALKGGDTGPAIDPAKPGNSLLLAAVRYDGDLRMPPKGKLSDAEIAVLAEWLKGGAPWPDSGVATAADAAKPFDLKARAAKHWSFQPVRRTDPPGSTDPAWNRSPVDRFIRAKLDVAGLPPAAPAGKRVLLRRVTFDLTGLPPAPAEIDAFLADESPTAFEKVVDRLLASPHFGERWGRHWLDLVRYAETRGHEFDFEIPDAWRYRDYVIRAFNDDLPYDQFVREQVAGDLLPDPRRHPTEGWNESLIATGFWHLGEGLHSPVDVRVDEANRVDNQIDVFGKAFLGLTVSCARCHDHKFDPIAIRDFYGLYGVVTSSRYQHAFIDDPAPAARILDELKAARAELGEPTADAADSLRVSSGSFESFGAGWAGRWFTTGLAFRDPTAGPPHSGRESGRLAGVLRSPTFTIDAPILAVRVAGRDARLRVIVDGLQLIQNPIYGGLAVPVNHGSDFRWVSVNVERWRGHAAYLELHDDGPGFFAVDEVRFTAAPPGNGPQRSAAAVPNPDPVVPKNATAHVKELADRIRRLEASLPVPRRVPAMADGTGRDERVFLRGNPSLLGEEAPRRFLEVFAGPTAGSPTAGSGRAELARALTDPANPVVARVMANRVWQHLFGVGLVPTPDDFGYQGQPPTHPELLDWLATDFMANGWSVKGLIRQLVLTETYRMSSTATPEVRAKAAVTDPQNKLLHRMNVKRLEAEAVRDAMLAVSGRLDQTAGGPGVMPHLTDQMIGRGGPKSSGPIDGDGRRSVYLAVRRNFLNPMLAAFDAPTPFTTIGRRMVSNVPAQALVMLNNPFVLQQAEVWAKRTTDTPGRPAGDRVARMYEAAFARRPTPAEMSAAETFAAESGWASLAHALFNAKEFVFVE